MSVRGEARGRGKCAAEEEEEEEKAGQRGNERE